jgi:hypothetical protein
MSEIEMKENAVNFAKWLQHTDNGDIHYNPFTMKKSESIGYSPNDCLYDKWVELSEQKIENVKKTYLQECIDYWESKKHKIY